MALTYRDAGVDIDAGNELVKRIGPAVKSTRRPEVLGAIGGFAGMMSIPTGYREPILVSGSDGVGTKLRVAIDAGRHRGVGIDLVAMSVNDILVTGAQPLFFLDYYATAKLDVDIASEVIEGIADGCQQAGCALLGGETAEMPGMYQAGDYDLAGFCVGVVERSQVRNENTLRAGDILVGIASSGLHSNGYSLARKALFDKLALSLQDCPKSLSGASLAQELCRPTIIYSNAFRALEAEGIVFRRAAHITGGGLIENPPRMLAARSDLQIRIDTSALPAPAIFDLIQTAGIERNEMLRSFNMGIGMLIAFAKEDADKAFASIEAAGYRAALCGELVTRDGASEAVRID